MRSFIIVQLVVVLTGFQSVAQGISNFEIWGWEGTKVEFFKIYKDSIHNDLSHGYTCMADLQKLGFEHSTSDIWVDDIEKYMSGKLNWDSIQRLTIVRQIPETKYSRLALDSLKLLEIEALISSIEKLDSISIANYLSKNELDLLNLLVGNFSKNMKIRSQCSSIIRKCPKLKISPSESNAEILGAMLSFPDIRTAYTAMMMIQNSNFPQSLNSKLFEQGATTIIDFLNSTLQTFRQDAVDMLEERKVNTNKKTTLEWQNWIESFN